MKRCCPTTPGAGRGKLQISMEGTFQVNDDHHPNKNLKQISDLDNMRIQLEADPRHAVGLARSSGSAGVFAHVRTRKYSLRFLINCYIMNELTKIMPVSQTRVRAQGSLLMAVPVFLAACGKEMQARARHLLQVCLSL